MKNNISALNLVNLVQIRYLRIKRCLVELSTSRIEHRSVSYSLKEPEV